MEKEREPAAIIKTMAAKMSLAAELFRAITAPKLNPIPAYLPECDGITVDWFLQSEYARAYAIDTSNLHWGGEVNKDHLFDIYKNFSSDKDSVKTRMSMLEFVAENVTRYTRNCYCYLRMNELTLDQWVRKMTHFDNGGDVLSLYAMSDMFGVHTTVLTKGRAWTTVHGNYPGSLDDVLQLSDVKLAYLGQDRFATLWKKLSPEEPSLRERSFNYAPMLPLAEPPTRVEMETAETLVNMQQSVPPADTSASMPHPPEFDSPNVASSADAMDKITDRYDFNPVGRPLILDAMDQIIGLDALKIIDVRSLAVETDVQPPNQDGNDALCVETPAMPSPTTKESVSNEGLCVETKGIVLKECSVKLQTLESILFTNRSSGRKNRSKPQDPGTTPKPTPLPLPLPLPDQPTQGKEADPQDTAQSTNTEDDVPPPPVNNAGKPPTSTKRGKKYGCRMCEVWVDSAHELKTHHTNNHGIMYCKTCTKAFNNQLSLTRHEYEHKTRPYVCTVCGEDFPFESQLATHKLSHSERRKYACTVTDCGKRFKNLGDRNRHVKEHTSPWLHCPDCTDYKTKAKRDLESHRLTHSKIERYSCERCGKGFVYSTQKIRHLSKKLCKK